MNELETEKPMEALKRAIPPQKKSTVPPESPANTKQTHVASWYAGPIPPPEYLRQYEMMVPGIAETFLKEPHLEAEHRRALEKKMIDAQMALGKRGQIMACVLACACVIGSFSAIFLGHSIWGLGALFLSIGGFISVFLYGKRQKTNHS